jgi:hypothetical protein
MINSKQRSAKKPKRNKSKDTLRTISTVLKKQALHLSGRVETLAKTG